MTEVSGKTLLVTGGGSGIGLGIARAFARAGAKVAIADISLDRAREAAAELGGVGVQLDVAEPGAWPAAIAAVEAALGPIDILANSAGIGSGNVPVVEMDERWMRRLYEINLFGAITGMKLVAPGMKARGGGHIINIASSAAVSHVPNQADYAGAKAALAMMSECFATEMKADGVGVTIVCPGRVSTRFKESTEAIIGAKRRESISPVPKKLMVGDEVGVLVLKAVRKDRLWCFTHPEIEERVERRWDAMRGAFAEIPVAV